MNIILKNGSGEIEEKKSRFICHIFKIKSEEEAEEYITAVRRNTGMQDITAMLM